jgi:hypothetical protein
MRKLTIATFVTASFIAGCSSTEAPNPYAGYEGAIQVPVRLHQDFYSSWGHSGRGGAALRKPAYQHVMGSEDMVMTTHGNYKELREASGDKQPTAFNTALNQGTGTAITKALNSLSPITGAITSGANPSGASTSRVASLSATNNEYEAAYRKFCNGASMAMTEREWEIVALGGPKGIPPNLRAKCMHSK